MGKRRGKGDKKQEERRGRGAKKQEERRGKKQEEEEELQSRLPRHLEGSLQKLAEAWVRSQRRPVNGESWYYYICDSSACEILSSLDPKCALASWVAQRLQQGRLFVACPSSKFTGAWPPWKPFLQGGLGHIMHVFRQQLSLADPGCFLADLDDVTTFADFILGLTDPDDASFIMPERFPTFITGDMGVVESLLLSPVRMAALHSSFSFTRNSSTLLQLSPRFMYVGHSTLDTNIAPPTLDLPWCLTPVQILTLPRTTPHFHCTFSWPDLPEDLSFWSSLPLDRPWDREHVFYKLGRQRYPWDEACLLYVCDSAAYALLRAAPCSSSLGMWTQKRLHQRRLYINHTSDVATPAILGKWQVWPRMDPILFRSITTPLKNKLAHVSDLDEMFRAVIIPFEGRACDVVLLIGDDRVKAFVRDSKCRNVIRSYGISHNIMEINDFDHLPKDIGLNLTLDDPAPPSLEWEKNWSW